MNHVFTRAVPGALAVSAVLGLGALAPASAATCGTPAQPATYQTVVHPAVTDVVPAVTHDEWLWTRQVATVTREVSRTTPGYDVIRWSRSTDAIEVEYAETVVDQAAVAPVAGTPEQGHDETVVVQPAVTETQYEYQQLVTGNTRWERAGWNAGDNGKGWSATGATRDHVLVPAVTEQVWVVDVPATPGTPGSPEVTHVELHWLAQATTPPAGWTATGNSRVASTSTETQDLPQGQSPDGTGWVAGAVVDTVAPVVDTRWIGISDPVPAGYEPTGATHTDTSTETTSARSASAPAGDGWTAVADSRVSVVDQPAGIVIVTPAWPEQVLVSPAVPAGPDCVTPPPVVPPVVDPGQSGGDVAGPTGPGGHAPAGHHSAGQHAAPTVQAAAAPEAGVLPNTGSDARPWMPVTGVTAVLLGIALLRRSRRAA